MKKHRLNKDVKEQIINRIKNEGVSVVQAAADHGISENTIYGWIAKRTEGQPTLSEIIQLKRENTQLLQLVGEMTLSSCMSPPSLTVYTRKVVGIAVYTTHAAQLVLAAFMNALHDNARPLIFHSDNSSEYNAAVYVEALQTVGTMISRSAPGCPWENGYQESFYSQFKIDLGDLSRFKTLGELVLAVYQTIWQYNHTRIHSALKMPPMQFALQAAQTYNSADKDGVQ